LVSNVSLYIAFQYIMMIRMIGCKIETEIVVGWFEVEIWVVRGSLWYGACEEEAWLWINRNCMDCEAMCGSLCWIDYEVLECDTCEPPLFLNVLSDIKWIVFVIQTCLRRIVKCMFSRFRMLLSTYQFSGSLWKCL